MLAIEAFDLGSGARGRRRRGQLLQGGNGDGGGGVREALDIKVTQVTSREYDGEIDMHPSHVVGALIRTQRHTVNRPSDTVPTNLLTVMGQAILTRRKNQTIQLQTEEDRYLSD